MTSTPRPCSTMATSLPSSPEPQSRTFLAVGDSGVPIEVTSGLFQETGFQHQPLDLVGVALDFLGVAGEANVLDGCAALEGYRRTLDLEVLDDLHRIAVFQEIAVAVAYFVGHGIPRG